MGRVLYDGWSSYWPGRDEPVAAIFNTMPKYVVSNPLREATWNSTTLINADVAENPTGPVTFFEFPSFTSMSCAREWPSGVRGAKKTRKREGKDEAGDGPDSPRTDIEASARTEP